MLIRTNRQQSTEKRITNIPNYKSRYPTDHRINAQSVYPRCLIALANSCIWALMPKRKKPELAPKEQFKRFVETGREHEVDERVRIGAAFKKAVPPTKPRRTRPVKQVTPRMSDD